MFCGKRKNGGDEESQSKMDKVSKWDDAKVIIAMIVLMIIALVVVLVNYFVTFKEVTKL